jgi:hypothetical protein
MKAGDLIQYIGFGAGDDTIGVVVSVSNHPSVGRPFAKVAWSLRSGPRYDEVPLEDLEIISE